MTNLIFVLIIGFLIILDFGRGSTGWEEDGKRTATQQFPNIYVTSTTFVFRESYWDIHKNLLGIGIITEEFLELLERFNIHFLVVYLGSKPTERTGINSD